MRTHPPTHIHTYIHTYIHTHTHTQIKTHAHTHVPRYTCTHACSCTQAHVRAHERARTHIRAHARAYTHTRARTHSHMHTMTACKRSGGTAPLFLTSTPRKSLSPQPQYLVNRWRAILDIFKRRKMSCICLVPTSGFYSHSLVTITNYTIPASICLK